MEQLEQNFGIAEDPRSEEEKNQDYKHADVYGSSVVWEKKDDLKHYTKRNQNGSLSCCGQGSAKGVETIVGKQMSAFPPYRNRSNYPAGGMFTQDIGNVWYKFGSCLESELNSQNLHESEMAGKYSEKTPYKIKGYLQPNCKDIEEIAQAIETWGHCMLIFHANGNEWGKKPVYNGLPVNFGHCICAVDYFLDDNGVKCLWIEDSASLNTTIDGQHRVITEDYLKARCSSAIYFLGVNPLEIPYTFTKVLRMGSVGFDVKKLQTKLNDLGYALTVDGKFGMMTYRAVVNFQQKHQLVADGIVGKNTNKILNE